MGSDKALEIFHRDTHAVVEILLGSVLRTNPVTLLFSTDSCSRRDSVKLRSRISAITALSASHFSASSMAHITSFSFFRSTKMKWSGCMPKALSAGGNIFREVDIHMVAPEFFMSCVTIPAMKPLVAVEVSLEAVKNSWTAAVGKVEFGK